MSIDKVLDNLELNHPVKCPDTDAWYITGIAARVGVQSYPEFGYDAFRDESVIKAMVEALRTKPLALGHFEQRVNLNTDKDAGLIVDSVYKDGLAIVRVRIDHPEICKILDSSDVSNKHIGLSVGYRTPMEKHSGVWVDTHGVAGVPGKRYPYTVRQVLPVKVNHLAIVPMGRGGEIVKLIMDEKPENENLFSFYDASVLVGADNDSSLLRFPLNGNFVDGGALYPYPNISTGRETMDDNKKDMAAMYDGMQSMMDKLSRMCTDMSSMYDKYMKTEDKMAKACDSMAEYADNLSASLNYLQAIKEAFESQDRNSGSKELGVPTQNMIADSACEAFGKEVEAAVKLWLEFSDELKGSVKEFSTSAASMRRILLENAGITFEDSALPGEIDAAFRTYTALKSEMKSAASPSESSVARLFKSVSDAAPSPDTSEGITRKANGGITFGE